MELKSYWDEWIFDREGVKEGTDYTVFQVFSKSRETQKFNSGQFRFEYGIPDVKRGYQQSTLS